MAAICVFPAVSNIIQLIPEIPSENFRTARKRDRSGQNPEYVPDPKSSRGYDNIDNRSDWQHLCAVIQERLENRGISKDIGFISDNLSAFANREQDKLDEQMEADRQADIADFNAHISKLTPLHAAVLLLRIVHRWKLSAIADRLNICDEQAGNIRKKAKKYFDSDLIQVDFVGHEINLDTPVDDLVKILVANRHQRKSNAGRPPKVKQKKQQSADLFDGVFL